MIVNTEWNGNGNARPCSTLSPTCVHLVSVPATACNWEAEVEMVPCPWRITGAPMGLDSAEATLMSPGPCTSGGEGKLMTLERLRPNERPQGYWGVMSRIKSRPLLIGADYEGKV